jgi:hypothetical protein
VSLKILINVDIDGYLISRDEVIELSAVIAESYPEPGNYVASFGFLTYRISRTENGCVVNVDQGFGHHSLMNGIDENLC